MSSLLHGKTITSDLRDQWLRERQPRIGASEIASAIGINPYDSQLRLFLTKTGRLPPKEQTEPMELGTLLEPAILGLYTHRTGHAIVRKQVFFVSHQQDFLSATLDGINDAGVNVQVKNVGCQSAIYWGEDGSDDVPHHVIVQAQQEMYCSGINETDVVALIGGNDLRVYHLTIDARVIKHILVRGLDFMTRVRKNIFPEPDKSRDQEIVKYLFPECDGTIMLDEAQSADVLNWERLGQELKSLEIEHKALKMALTMALGNASQARLTNDRILYRRITNVAPSVRTVKGYSFPVFRLSKEVTVELSQEDQL